VSPIYALNWPMIRAVVLLKRCAKALESIADTQAKLLTVERERTPAIRPVRHAEFSLASPSEWDKQYLIDHPPPEETEVS